MDNENGRNQGDRIGALEQDMKVVKWRLDDVDRRHDSSPERLAKVESVMAHQSEKLDDLETAVNRIHRSVEQMGSKISWAMGAAAVVIIVFNKAWPLIAGALS